MADTIDIGALVNDAARRYGVDPKLANVVVTMESQGNPNADSGKAKGVMQLTPATAQWLGVKDIWDPVDNINGGMKYLAQLSRRYDDDPRLVLAAYNAGPGAVDRFGGVPPFRETQGYVNRGVGMLRSRLLEPPPPGSSPGEPGVSSRSAPAAAPVDWFANNAPAGAPAAADWFASNAPSTEPSPLEKAGRAFYQGIGGPSLLDIGKGVLGEVTGDQPAIEKGKQALGGMVQGLAAEPGRVGGELKQAYGAVMQGDLPQVGYHIASATPLIGTGLQQVMQDVTSGDPAAAVGHMGAVVAPFVVGPALRGVATGAEATSRAAAATEAGIRAGAADVAAGAAKTAAGGAAASVVPGPGKWFVGEYLTRPGRRQMLAGIQKGVAAAREALAPGEAAAAPAEEAMAAGAGAAEPAPPAAPSPAPPEAPAPPEPPKTPGQVYAESQGIDWSKASPNDQLVYEHIARAQENVRAQQPPPQAAPPPVAPPAAPVSAAPESPPAPAPETPQTPQQIAQALKAEMEQSGTVPPPEPPSFAETARAKKVDALFDVMTRNKIPLSMVEQFGPKEWDLLAKYAGVNPPSDISIGQLKQRLSDYEKARNIPVTPATTPAEIQTAFEQARATRAARRRPPPVR